VPNDLTESQKREHVEKSTVLLSVLANAKRCAWSFIFTGDWFCFFDYEAHSKTWLSPDADSPEVAKHLINIPKVMITIFWNPFGIHVLAALPERTSLDAEYFIDYVLTQLNSFLLHMRLLFKNKQLLSIWTIRSYTSQKPPLEKLDQYGP
jgi:hypothetical protein